MQTRVNKFVLDLEYCFLIAGQHVCVGYHLTNNSSTICFILFVWNVTSTEPLLP